MRARHFKPAFRHKLTFWYVALFSVSLSIFEVDAYFEVRSSLFSLIDSSLSAEADQIGDDLDVANGQASPKDEPTRGPALSSANTAFMIRSVDGNGRTLGSETGFPALAPGAARPGIATVSAGHALYRVLTRQLPPVFTAAQTFIQVAAPLNTIEIELREVLMHFLIGLPLTLLIAAAGGLLLAHAAFQPVVALTDLAAKVGGDKLSERLAYSGPDDEIGRLAATFNVMLDRLEASFLREKRFTADASHELKTPLTAIKVKIDVSLSRERTAEEYREVLEGMKPDVDRLISLSADLLLLARMGNVALASRKEKVDLNELVDSCLEQVASAAAGKSVSVSRDYGQGLVVEGARDYLIRLFLNVLDNAAKYADAPCSIAVRTSSDGAFAKVEIADSGYGIPEADLPFVFSPFYRAGGDRSRERGGAGLGLAIAHEIVEAHGGRLDIASRLGAGTTVTIALPIASAT